MIQNQGCHSFNNDIYPSWPVWRRSFFRFGFIYIILYCIGGTLSYVGLGGIIGKATLALTRFVAKSVLGIQESIPDGFTGSGDRLGNFVELYTYASLALVGMIIWSFFDQRTRHHGRLHHWLRVYVRYTLALSMLGYGFAKVFWLQMGPPSLYRLLQPLGEFSPMGLAWTFMGYSKGYSMFAGMMEVIGGLLLFWRRTTLLGALVLVGVLLNVVLMNFCFDIPVKLYSMHLLLFAIFLTMKDWPVLYNFIWIRKSSQLPIFIPHFPSKGLNIAGLVIKYLIIVLLLFQNINQGFQNQKVYGTQKERHALLGIYEVDNYVVNGQSVPRNLDEEERWNKVVFDRKDYGQIWMMNNEKRFTTMKVDSTGNQLEYKTRGGAGPYNLEILKPHEDTLGLRGIIGDSTQFEVWMHRIDKDYELTSRGFNWVNDVPYNR